MSKEEYFDYLKLCAEITDKLDNTAEYESWLLVQDYADYEHRELIRLNSIIKEVRKYIDKNGLFSVDTYNFANGILKIIDKVEENK